MFFTKINSYRKFISLVASFALLVNSFAAPVTIIAQELSSPEATPVIEETPVAEATEVPTEPEVTVEPTLDPTVTATASPLPDEEVVVAGELSVNTSEVVETTLESPMPEPDLDEPVDNSSATLVSSVSTDKADYAPTDQVIVTATDLQPNTLYLLKISSSDPPPVTFETNSTTDENGSFVYNYQLDGTYRPNYLVEIFLGGTLITSTTFTDSHIASHLCQVDTLGADDQPGQKDLTQMCIDYTGLNTSIKADWNWDETGWSGSNTGDGCALFDNDNDGLANYAVCVTVEDDPAVQATNSPRLYSCNDTKADRCAGSSLIVGPYTTSCSVAHIGDQPFATGASTPTDVKATCTIQLSEVGGEIDTQLLDVCSYPSEQPNSDPSDCVVFRARAGKLEVKKELVPETDSGLFNLLIDSVVAATNIGDNGTTGEKVVDEGNHTVSETAGTSTDLAKYSTSLVCRDLNGTGSIVYQSTGTGPHSVNVPDQSDIVCVFTNEVAVGNIIVDKVTDPSGDTQSFDFIVGGSGYSNFSLTDAAAPNNQELLAGTYSVSETVPAGWDLTSATCDDGSPIDAIDLAAGETVTCTFTNTKLASVTVIKDVFPNDGTEWDFLLAGPGQFANGILDLGDEESDTISDLLPGDYTLSESTQVGYATQVSCTTNEVGSDSVDFTLDPGEDITCTFTNTKLGKIIVEKQTNPNNSQQSFSFTASYDNDGFDLFDGQQNDSGYLAAGTYSVFENVPAGWDLTSATCSDRSSPSSINLAAGEVVTCVFTNTQYATIIIEKQTNPDGAVGSFDFTGDLSGTISDGGTLTANNVLPGQYEVTESDPTTEFDLTGISCDDNNSTGDLGTRTATFNVEAGETIKCTFTNTERGSISGYKYEDEDGDTTTNDLTGVLGWSIELYSCSQDFLTCALQSSTTTAGDGSYSFAALIPGYYQVREILSNGWTNLTSLFLNVTVDPGEEETDLNFINFELATIIVHKDVYGPFGANVSDSQEFSILLNGDSQETISEGNDVTYSDLGPGTYTVTENTPPFGYELDSISDNGVVEVTSGGVFHVYIRNNQLPAELTVIKHVINDDGGLLTADDFTMNVTGTDVSDTSFPGDESGTTVQLNAGAYSVDEGLVSGYAKSLSTDCLGTIGFGESKTCTITNDDITGRLIVRKVVINDNGGTNEVDDFSFEVNGDSAIQFEADGENELNVPAGLYSIIEPAVSGYQTTYDNCVRIQVTNDGVQICTITNDDVAPSLTLIKNLITDDGGQETESDWTLFANGPTSFNGVGPSVSSNASFEAGSYDLSESGPLGYSASDWVCDGGTQDDSTITLAVGESATCSITNDDIAPTLTLTKTVVTDNGGTAVEGDFAVYIDQVLASWGTHEVTVGNHQVSEDSLTGYVPGTWGGDCDESGNVSLNPGDSKECTVTNDDQPGEVLACKYEDLTGDGPSEDDLLLDGVTLNLGNGEEVDSKVTENGCVTFENVNAGDYQLWEDVPEGFYKTFPEIEQYEVVITNGSSNSEEPFLFYNARLSAIGDYIWEDLDLDGDQDAGEPAFLGIVVNLYKDDGDGIGEPGTDDVFVGTATTGADGLYLFEGLVAGDYWVVVDTDSVPAGYVFTTAKRFFVTVFGGTTYLDADFGLVSPTREIEITKSNDKQGGASLGDTVNYTLQVENTGQVDLYDLVVYDVLPGGFSYVLGSTLVNGLPFSDPTNDGGKLTWNLGLIEAGQTIEIKYQATIASDLDPATYVNIATCAANSLGEVRERDLQLLVLGEGNEVIECNIATSGVPIGGTSSLTGGVGGQVLGAAIALPASGNRTGLLFIFLALIAAGSIIKYANKKYLEEKK